MNLSSKTLQPEIAPRPAILIRSLGWCSLGFLLAFLINNVLTVGFNYPGTLDFLKTPSLTNLLQPLVYAVLFFLAVLWSIKTSNTTLRKDAKKITAINAYIIRGCFFSVLLIGLIDASIAWLRVEGLLTTLFNESTASALLRSGFIGPKIHLPLIALGFLIAIFSRTLGFLWLALMIVGAELLIVISRFVFSYEQTLMGDLVRYWPEKGNYSNNSNFIIGLILFLEAKSMGVDIKEKAKTTKHLNTYLDPDSFSKLSLQSGFREANRYASGGCELMKDNIQKPNLFGVFLKKFYEELNRQINSNRHFS